MVRRNDASRPNDAQGTGKAPGWREGSHPWRYVSASAMRSESSHRETDTCRPARPGHRPTPPPRRSNQSGALHPRCACRGELRWDSALVGLRPAWLNRRLRPRRRHRSRIQARSLRPRRRPRRQAPRARAQQPAAAGTPSSSARPVTHPVNHLRVSIATRRCRLNKEPRSWRGADLAGDALVALLVRREGGERELSSAHGAGCQSRASPAMLLVEHMVGVRTCRGGHRRLGEPRLAAGGVCVCASRQRQAYHSWPACLPRCSPQTSVDALDRMGRGNSEVQLGCR